MTDNNENCRSACELSIFYIFFIKMEHACQVFVFKQEYDKTLILFKETIYDNKDRQLGDTVLTVPLNSQSYIDTHL